ncbi:MAG: hypothetical protein M1825_002654 [Sarcosagium campestre]|nr:MAG: hypothetical protein M1825_002654 [Sarcosagium campestre]
MRVSSVIASLATAGTLAAAQNHHHRHHHLDKRTPAEAAPAVPIAIVYEFQSRPMSEAEYKEGLANGTLAPAEKKDVNAVCPPPVQPKPQAKPFKKPDKGLSFLAVSPVAQPAASSVPKYQSSKFLAKKPDSDYQSSSGGSGVDRDFPDGQLDCSHFPEEYGAVPVPWEGLGGWSGIQDCSGSSVGGNGIDSIVTVIAGGSCQEGHYCSYACPTGYQKIQWPETQGAKGESIGGILCKNGKLQLTNSKYKTLCIKGKGGIKVQNNLGKALPICRTDYPGTESMTHPANFDDTATEYELTCPDQSTFRTQSGALTTAQYYVNCPGTPMKDGCTWNKQGSNRGNFAPLNVGCGYDQGTNWLSLQRNDPTNPNGILTGVTVNITGGSVSCEYSNGKFYENGVEKYGGCTVSPPPNVWYIGNFCIFIVLGLENDEAKPYDGPT